MSWELTDDELGEMYAMQATAEREDVSPPASPPVDIVALAKAFRDTPGVPFQAGVLIGELCAEIERLRADER